METKHTKGEWIADVTESTFEQTIRTKEGIRIAEAKSFGNPFNDATIEERIANAKLISASPDLLEACEKLLVDFIYSLSMQGKSLGWSDERISEQIEKHPLIISSRKAINKATK